MLSVGQLADLRQMPLQIALVRDVRLPSLDPPLSARRLVTRFHNRVLV